MERIRNAGMATGYRFKIIDFRSGHDTSVVCVAKIGVAPIYRDAFISVNGVRSVESLITLMPGKCACYEIEGGGEHPTLEFQCDHLVAGQKIEFEANLKAE